MSQTPEWRKSMQPEPDFIIDAHKRREMVPYSDP